MRSSNASDGRPEGRVPQPSRSALATVDHPFFQGIKPSRAVNSSRVVPGFRSWVLLLSDSDSFSC